MREQGSGLVIVRVIVVIAGLLVAAMTAGQGMAIRRSGLLFSRGRALELLAGFESWSLVRLARDRAANAVDSMDEEWAAVLPPVPTGSGTISGRILDMQGRINVNDLVLGDDAVKERTRTRLLRLFGLCGVDPLALVALEDWLDADDDPRPMGAEADFYLAGESPVRPANRAIMDVVQLARLRYMEDEGFRCLAPNLAALPEATAVNVNTAPAPVLASLAAGISPDEVDDIVPEGGFASVTDFLALNLWKDKGLESAGLAVASSFFLAWGESVNEEGAWAMESLIRRGKGVEVLRRRLVAPTKVDEKKDGQE